METREEKITQAVEDLGNACNSFNHEPDTFIKAFCKEHRTTQQTMFGMMVQLIVFMSTDEYRTDGRNDYSKTIAKRLMDGYRQEFFKKEVEVLMNIGYDEESAETKATQYLMDFDKNPKQYLNLPCV